MTYNIIVTYSWKFVDFNRQPITQVCQLSHRDILENLMLVANDCDPGTLASLEQLRGFCRKVKSEALVPFKSEDFSAQVARDIA